MEVVPIITWKEIAMSALALLPLILIMFLNSQSKRTDKMDGKFDANFTELFRRQAVMQSDMSKGFLDVRLALNNMYIDFMERLDKKEDKHTK